VLIRLAFLSFRRYALNDSAYIGYAALLYCRVLSINDDDDDDDDDDDEMTDCSGASRGEGSEDAIVPFM